MKTSATIAQMLVRAGALFQIVTGLLFWSGNLLALVQLHMLIGFIVALSLLVLAGLGAWSGLPAGRVVLAIGWALLVPVLGMTQTQLLPGDLHWIVRVVHLLVGLGAVWMAEGLARRVRAGPGRVQPVAEEAR
jgi:hypothetical protein